MYVSVEPSLSVQLQNLPLMLPLSPEGVSGINHAFLQQKEAEKKELRLHQLCADRFPYGILISPFNNLTREIRMHLYSLSEKLRLTEDAQGYTISK